MCALHSRGCGISGHAKDARANACILVRITLLPVEKVLHTPQVQVQQKVRDTNALAA